MTSARLTWALAHSKARAIKHRKLSILRRAWQWLKAKRGVKA